MKITKTKQTVSFIKIKLGYSQHGTVNLETILPFILYTGSLSINKIGLNEERLIFYMSFTKIC